MAPKLSKMFKVVTLAVLMANTASASIVTQQDENMLNDILMRENIGNNLREPENDVAVSFGDKIDGKDCYEKCIQQLGKGKEAYIAAVKCAYRCELISSEEAKRRIEEINNKETNGEEDKDSKENDEPTLPKEREETKPKGKKTKGKDPKRSCYESCVEPLYHLPPGKETYTRAVKCAYRCEIIDTEEVQRRMKDIGSGDKDSIGGGTKPKDGDKLPVNPNCLGEGGICDARKLCCEGFKCTEGSYRGSKVSYCKPDSPNEPAPPKLECKPQSSTCSNSSECCEGLDCVEGTYRGQKVGYCRTVFY